jgi:hypothetical protein
MMLHTSDFVCISLALYFPVLLFCLNHFVINLKAEASKIEEDMQNIQQEIDSLHSSVTRLFNCPAYLWFNYNQVNFLVV